MNSKERVLTALRRTGVPDRVPLQFDLCRSLSDAFGEKYGIPVHYTTAYYEDVTYRLSANELRVAMGSDCVVVGASLPRGHEHPVDENGYPSRIRFPSSTGHVESCVNPARPWAKAKYSLMTDSELVP